MTPKQKHNWSIILRFTVFWTLFGLVYGVVEYGILGETGVYPSTQNVYGGISQLRYIVIGAGTLGLIVGILEVFVFKNLFLNKQFVFKTIFKAVIYVILIALFLLVIGAVFVSHRLGISIFSQQIIDNQVRFVTNFAFLSIMQYIALTLVVNLFIFEISKHLGLMVVANFITSKYHKPRVEERIFMFMDMKSSTTIAEELGHVKYYQLLNKYYSDMSDDIINSEGEIYQYVGDEIIITWPMDVGIKNSNCIACFYQIKKTIQSKSEEYMKRFGVVPEFKAALHCGKVTTGEIGELKKAIVFTGDVLNTTARIQALCNEYNTELLASSKLLKSLDIKPSLKVNEIGDIELRGKLEKVTINKIEFQI